MQNLSNFTKLQRVLNICRSYFRHKLLPQYLFFIEIYDDRDCMEYWNL